MFTLMTLFGLVMFAVVVVTAVALVAVVAKVILLPFRLLLLPLKLLVLPFIAIALVVKFAFLIAICSIVVALLIPLAILALVHWRADRHRGLAHMIAGRVGGILALQGDACLSPAH